MNSGGEPLTATDILTVAGPLTASAPRRRNPTTPRRDASASPSQRRRREAGSPPEQLQLTEWDGQLPVPYNIVPF